MKRIKNLGVYYHGRRVGTLALYKSTLAAFQYDKDWIIKFPSNTDRRDIGLQEYEYSVCAKACGIEMEETRLFPSKYCEGYFGTRRFDVEREGSLRKRVHMVSAAGLLETSHRIPNLDYDTLMRLTMILTKDYTEIEKLHRRMCFNVYAHNRDDHSKNFSYLYNEDKNRWILSPAYDLTYSFSFGGEHATTVNGNGADPDKGDLLAVADNIGMNHHNASETADEIRELTEKMLGQYLR